MQADIIDMVLHSTGRRAHLVDPFVGSGTTMTEALLRGLRFTGVDINPLAVLTCEAKLAIDSGTNVLAAARTVLKNVAADRGRIIDVDFPNRTKWFSNASAVVLSRLRRSIMRLRDTEARKVMWTVFSETIRRCSNSRTSTYKLHIRVDEDLVPAEGISSIFEGNLNEAVRRAREYQQLVQPRRRGANARLLCGDVRHVQLPYAKREPQIVVTSPPYGDNQTTIPYGQFSYLALRWIPTEDLPQGCQTNLFENTHALDAASLGGSRVEADSKSDTMRLVSPAFESFASLALRQEKSQSIRKVGGFAYDFFEAMAAIRPRASEPAHWILTTGNRTVDGMRVPLDGICRDIIAFLGGKPIATLHRKLPNKRMPTRNSMGAMITRETTLVAEF